MVERLRKLLIGTATTEAELEKPCVFWKWIARKNENTDAGEAETKQIPLIRYYNVFNVEQCDGLTHKRLEVQAEEPAHFDPIEAAESIVASYPAAPSISEDGGASAYYRPRTDSIHMPKRESFDSEAHYYATLFHEMAHSTGHETPAGTKHALAPGVHGASGGDAG